MFNKRKNRFIFLFGYAYLSVCLSVFLSTCICFCPSVCQSIYFFFTIMVYFKLIIRFLEIQRCILYKNLHLILQCALALNDTTAKFNDIMFFFINCWSCSYLLVSLTLYHIWCTLFWDKAETSISKTLSCLNQSLKSGNHSHILRF